MDFVWLATLAAFFVGSKLLLDLSSHLMGEK